jgi:hypothetical protein
MKNDKIYYVYIYLNPLKPGYYNYGNFHFDFEPFYVGKGKGNRYLIHLNEAERKNTKKLNRHKINTIKNIIKSNNSPLISLLNLNITDYESQELEKYYIKTIGRADLGLGPLTNLTDGGDGGTRLHRKIKKYNCSYCNKNVCKSAYTRWHNNNCLQKPGNESIKRISPLKGKKRGKIKGHKTYKKQKKMYCSWCLKKFNSGNYKQYHGNNCKMKPGNENIKRKGNNLGKKWSLFMYKCSFCDKLLGGKGNLKKHEKCCKLNTAKERDVKLENIIIYYYTVDLLSTLEISKKVKKDITLIKEILIKNNLIIRSQSETKKIKKENGWINPLKGKPKEKLECPNCRGYYSISTYKRYNHGYNCRKQI